MGSYYVPCKIIKRNKNSFRISYEDSFDGEIIEVTVDKNDIANIKEYYNLFDKNSSEKIFDFLEGVKRGEIELGEAIKVIQNGGTINRDF